MKGETQTTTINSTQEITRLLENNKNLPTNVEAKIITFKGNQKEQEDKITAMITKINNMADDGIEGSYSKTAKQRFIKYLNYILNIIDTKKDKDDKMIVLLKLVFDQLDIVNTNIKDKRTEIGNNSINKLFRINNNVVRGIQLEKTTNARGEKETDKYTTNELIEYKREISGKLQQCITDMEQLLSNFITEISEFSLVGGDGSNISNLTDLEEIPTKNNNASKKFRADYNTKLKLLKEAYEAGLKKNISDFKKICEKLKNLISGYKKVTIENLEESIKSSEKKWGINLSVLFPNSADPFKENKGIFRELAKNVGATLEDIKRGSPPNARPGIDDVTIANIQELNRRRTLSSNEDSLGSLKSLLASYLDSSSSKSTYSNNTINSLISQQEKAKMGNDIPDNHNGFNFLINLEHGDRENNAKLSYSDLAGLELFLHYDGADFYSTFKNAKNAPSQKPSIPNSLTKKFSKENFIDELGKAGYDINKFRRDDIYDPSPDTEHGVKYSVDIDKLYKITFGQQNNANNKMSNSASTTGSINSESTTGSMASLKSASTTGSINSESTTGSMSSLKSAVFVSNESTSTFKSDGSDMSLDEWTEMSDRWREGNYQEQEEEFKTWVRTRSGALGNTTRKILDGNQKIYKDNVKKLNNLVKRWKESQVKKGGRRKKKSSKKSKKQSGGFIRGGVLFPESFYISDIVM